MVVKIRQSLFTVGLIKINLLLPTSLAPAHKMMFFQSDDNTLITSWIQIWFKPAQPDGISSRCSMYSATWRLMICQYFFMIFSSFRMMIKVRNAKFCSGLGITALNFLVLKGGTSLTLGTFCGVPVLNTLGSKSVLLRNIETSMPGESLYEPTDPPLHPARIARALSKLDLEVQSI